MPPQPSGGGGRATWASHDDNGGFYLIVLLICSCVGAYLLWTNYHGTISRGVMQVFHQEIGLLRHFTVRFNEADQQMMHVNPEGVTLKGLYGMSHEIGMFVRIPVALLMLALAFVCMVRAAPSRFRRGFDLDGLTREQAVLFPSTAAFVARKFRLVAPAPAAPRPSDYALTPDEWLSRFASDSAGQFDPGKARLGLIRQLGPRWSGTDHASPGTRCLFAVFALHLAERRAEAAELLGAVSVALATPGMHPRSDADDEALKFPESVAADVERAFSEYSVAAPALAIARRHAYTHPALMSVLNASRLQAGVLAPAQFAWLKLIDRPLWYALHSLGFEGDGADRYIHPNPRVEAVGVRDHWASEVVAGEAMMEPCVDRALEAMRKIAASPRKQAGPSASV